MTANLSVNGEQTYDASTRLISTLEITLSFIRRRKAAVSVESSAAKDGEHHGDQYKEMTKNNNHTHTPSASVAKTGNATMRCACKFGRCRLSPPSDLHHVHMRENKAR